MGHLLFLEDSRGKQVRKKSKHFDLSQQKIAYLGLDFEEH